MKTIHIEGIANKINLIEHIEGSSLFYSSDFPFDEDGREIKKNVFFRFYSSDRPCSLEESMQGFLEKLFGDLEAVGKCYGYSEYTIEGMSISSLKLGGHDLENLIKSQGDKYLHILIDTV